MSRHHGFTLVRLLAVIAIIGILIGLLLPAQQAARSTVARIVAYGESQSDESASLQPLEMKSKYVRRSKSLSAPTAGSEFKAKEGSPRKIVYKANINLVVTDFSQTESSLRDLVEQHGGFLADVRIDRRQGSRLKGHWQARIPVDQFNVFCEEVVDLGVAEQQQQTAQDVTEEFIDLEARIANKKRLEERIIDLLENSSGNIKAVIEIERELARVRDEIERMEGRLRYLTNHTELTTVSIDIREEQNYVPPKAPNYLDRISNAWHDSLKSAKEFGQRSLISLIYAFPWIVIAGVILLPSAWIFNRVRKRALIKSDENVSAE